MDRFRSVINLVFVRSPVSCLQFSLQYFSSHYQSRYRLKKCLLWGLIVLFLWGCLLQTSFADEATTRYFEQLRARYLFSLAEGYCLTQMKKENLPLAQRSRLTLELSRTFIAHARFVGKEEQAEYWKQAEVVLVEHLQKNPQLPGRELLDIQLAKIPAAEANWYRWELKTAPEDKEFIQKANGLFNLSLSRWQLLEKQIDERLRLRLKKKKGAGFFSLFELRTMLNNVRLQSAITALDHAELIPFGSDAYRKRLRQADKPLQILKNGPAEDERTWTSRLQLARAGRLRHDFKTSTAILKVIESDKPPEKFLTALAEEQAQLLLTWDKPADAAKLLSLKRKSGLPQTGLLRYLNIQALIALVKVTQQTENKANRELANALKQQIEGYVKRTTIEMGGYWDYRCQKLFGHFTQNEHYGEKVAGLVRQAKSAFAAGQQQDAIDLYGTATIAANQAGKKEVAMELGFRRASIQLQVKKYNAASVSFLELAKHFPQTKRAADAHLLGTYALGRIYLSSQTKENRDQYSQALEHHIKEYKQKPTVSEAIWMYATLKEQQQKISIALQAYLQTSANHKRSPLAQVAVGRCYRILLNRQQELKRSDQDQQQMEKRAIAQLTTYAKAYPPEAVKLSDRQAEVILQLAQLELNRRQPHFNQADRLLLHVIQASTFQIDKSSKDGLLLPIWKPMKRNATQLRILSLAGQNKYDDAKAIIEQIANQNIPEVLQLLAGLVQVASNSNETTRKQIGELQLKTARELYQRKKELTAPQLQQVERALAEAFVATGKISQARGFYSELIKKSPRDRTTLKTFATLSQQCGTKECLQEAKQTWKKLESLEKPGSVLWLSARFQVIECYLLLNEKKECNKLLTITKILYPKLGNAELRKKFIRLKKKLDRG